MDAVCNCQHQAHAWNLPSNGGWVARCCTSGSASGGGAYLADGGLAADAVPVGDAVAVAVTVAVALAAAEAEGVEEAHRVRLGGGEAAGCFLHKSIVPG